MENMTVLTKAMLESAIRIQSVQQAATILRETGNIRTLGDVLRSYSHSENPKAMLVDGLMSVTPTANRDSMDKKVRNWLSGRTSSVSKQDAFILSRILELDLAKTDTFLKYVTGEGIHWRDPEDIVWSYGINRGYSYEQIMALLNRATLFVKRAKESQAMDKEYTAQIKEDLISVFSEPEEALLEYLEQEKDNLGEFHNTAYRLFAQFMELLETGGTAHWQEDTEKMSSRDILENYMYRKVVPATKKKEPKDMFTGIQRSIRANWPDETTISKIKHRELDVPRKVLILLFLATDGSESEYEELDEDEDILTRDEIFQNIYTRLNRMLQSCGFQMLDSRSPFDWMVLYSICADEFWDVDQRLGEILLAMFPDGNENQ